MVDSGVPPNISTAAAADLPAIINLLQQAKLPPDGIEVLGSTTLVARANGAIVGCAALELYTTAALLRSVAVDASQRGQGLGQRLTGAALDLARALGVRTVYLITETAGGFFPRFGFAATDRSLVDAAVKQSVQFTKLCPDSALVMQVEL